jgi:predicted nucleic acid-binding protein
VLVVDANVVVEVTVERFGATALDALGDEQLVAPWLLWSEVPAAISAMVFRSEISRELGESALGRAHILSQIALERHRPGREYRPRWSIEPFVWLNRSRS